jgi:phosphoribosyl-ATP pyrophosphohydrolase
MSSDTFEDLFQVIESRKTANGDKSYVASLMAKGSQKIQEKILEEANEVVEAAGENDKKHLTAEICDLLFHSLVLASHHDITLQDINNEFNRRSGTSGLTEKANRQKKS